MYHSGHQDDLEKAPAYVSAGHETEGFKDVSLLEPIKWSSKTDHASIYSSALDMTMFLQHILRENLYAKSTWKSLFEDHGNRVGYGWFVRENLDRIQIQMNGRSPGYTSFVSFYPNDDLIIVALSNIYTSTGYDIGQNIAKIYFKKTYDPLLIDDVDLPSNLAKSYIGHYQFDEHFYCPNFELEVKRNDGKLTTEWGDLIPINNKAQIDEFILRTIWFSIRLFKNDGRMSMQIDRHVGIKKE